MYHVKTLSDKKADVKRLVHLGTLGTYRRNVPMIQFPPEMVENWWRYGGELVTK